MYGCKVLMFRHCEQSSTLVCNLKTCSQETVKVYFPELWLSQCFVFLSFWSFLCLCCSLCVLCWSHLWCDSILASSWESIITRWRILLLLICHEIWKEYETSSKCGFFFPFSAFSLHCSHSSCVPERSTRLITASLCVSCRVSPKALLAPLAQAAVRFQTA